MEKRGGVIKTIKKENPYVQIPNSIFTDDRLSFKAKGLLGYLLSKPNDWQTKTEDLYKQSTEGYFSIRSGVGELLLTGYMELKSVFGEEPGSFSGRYYVVMEEPLFKKGFRKLENKNKLYKEDEEIVPNNPLASTKHSKSSS